MSGVASEENDINTWIERFFFKNILKFNEFKGFSRKRHLRCLVFLYSQAGDASNNIGRRKFSEFND